MIAALQTAEAELKRVVGENVRLVTEVSMLRDECGKLRTERDRLQAYSANISARLDVVVEVIGRVQSEALKFSVRDVGKITPQDGDTSAAKVVEGMSQRTPVPLNSMRG